ncbi:MAG: hypothetical protein FRX49_07517 [Trebouxia sp. A1-2]|nr:MAG: hypothetical protein FRX49_07517 [Trebouxia sp. A1-2]
MFSTLARIFSFSAFSMSATCTAKHQSQSPRTVSITTTLKELAVQSILNDQMRDDVIILIISHMSRRLRRRQYLECASSLLDDVYAFQVAAALQPQHGIHSQPGKVLLVLRQNLGAVRKDSFIKAKQQTTTGDAEAFEEEVVHLSVVFAMFSRSCRKGLEDGGTIIGDHDVICTAHALQYLVLAAATNSLSQLLLTSVGQHVSLQLSGLPFP